MDPYRPVSPQDGALPSAPVDLSEVKPYAPHPPVQPTQEPPVPQQNVPPVQPVYYYQPPSPRQAPAPQRRVQPPLSKKESAAAMTMAVISLILGVVGMISNLCVRFFTSFSGPDIVPKTLFIELLVTAALGVVGFVLGLISFIKLRSMRAIALIGLILSTVSAVIALLSGCVLVLFKLSIHAFQNAARNTQNSRY